MKNAVLMFHAMLDDFTISQGADIHYAIKPEVFKLILDKIDSHEYEISSIDDFLDNKAFHLKANNMIYFTFDDGHDSNHECVEKFLVNSNAKADFFVNPSTIGKKNYISWSGLQDMSNSGMSIQSHGYTHRYFSDLNDAELYQELDKSKKELEDKLGRKVRVLAPPGGRYDERMFSYARKIGYECICTSEPGLWKVGETLLNIPRFPIYASTTIDMIDKIILSDARYIQKLRLKYNLRKYVKKVLGNSTYEKVRNFLLNE